MRLIISTCDKYINVLEAVKYTMDKFEVTNFDVTVLGFKPPNFDMGTWEFVSLGEDKGVRNFSNDITPFFNTFDDEYFILTTDDYVMTSRFNHEFFREITEFIKEVPNFGRMFLMNVKRDFYGNGNGGLYGSSSVIKSFGDYHIAELNQLSQYRLSLQHSIWKTSYFKKYLTPNLSPWDWERRDSAKHDGAAILLPIDNYVISAGHVMIKGNVSSNWHESIFGEATLDEGDIKIINDIFKKHGMM